MDEQKAADSAYAANVASALSDSLDDFQVDYRSYDYTDYDVVNIYTDLEEAGTSGGSDTYLVAVEQISNSTDLIMIDFKN